MNQVLIYVMTVMAMKVRIIPTLTDFSDQFHAPNQSRDLYLWSLQEILDVVVRDQLGTGSL